MQLQVLASNSKSQDAHSHIDGFNCLIVSLQPIFSQYVHLNAILIPPSSRTGIPLSK